MKKATDNKQRYKDAFDQIHLSEEAYRQIRNMEETIMDTNFRKNKKRKAAFTAIVSLASLAVVFLSANGIVYAATGDTLVDKITEHVYDVYVYIDGKPAEGDVKFYTDKDGNPCYEISVDDTSKPDSSGKKPSSKVEIHSSFIVDPITDPGKADGQTSDDKSAAYTDHPADGRQLTGTDNITDPEENFKTAIKQKKNKTFFIIKKEKGEPVKIDITKDFADGRASGTFKMDGGKYRYDIAGNVKEYSVELECIGMIAKAGSDTLSGEED